MGRAELERAAPVLSFADRGFGERNLANTFLRLDGSFKEESLGWFDIVEVEEERQSACWLRVALASLSHATDLGSTHVRLQTPSATRPSPALSPPALYQQEFLFSQAESPPRSH